MFLKKKLAIILGALGLLALVAGFPWVSALAAAEPTGFKAVQVWVNPEYDDPRVLTMIQGQITGATPPVTVRFLVPATAEMYSAGSIDVAGKYSGGPPDRVPSSISGWDEISYTLTSNTFRVEYYDDEIQGLPNKTISYDFRMIYPASDMVVWLQEPKNSSSFVVTPKEQSLSKDGDGLAVRRFTFSNLPKDSVTHFDVSYTKKDSKPSIGQNTSAAAPTGAGSGTSTTMWLAFGLAGVLAVVLVYILVSRSRRKPAPRPVRSRAERPLTAAQRASMKQEAEKAGTGKRFCTECGSRVEGSPKFCPECGAKL